MTFSGKRVILTGGNSGIGRAAAVQLAAQGAKVVVLARNAARNAETVAAMTSAGGRGCAALSCDVTQDADVARAIAEALTALGGGCDVLICCQGYARCAPVTAQSLEEMQALMDTNFWGHVRVVRALAPVFKAQRSGTIHLVASMLGFMSMYGYAAYSASKFAIAGFADGLRQEMLPYGVGVQVFYPPTTDTPGLTTENESKPALTRRIEGSSTTYTADDVARTMLSGIAAGREVNMVGVEAWAIYRLFKWMPSLVHWVIDREVHAHVREKGLDV
jgi:3-dehydrosphinganine reductase